MDGVPSCQHGQLSALPCASWPSPGGARWDPWSHKPFLWLSEPCQEDLLPPSLPSGDRELSATTPSSLCPRPDPCKAWPVCLILLWLRQPWRSTPASWDSGKLGKAAVRSASMAGLLPLPSATPFPTPYPTIPFPILELSPSDIIFYISGLSPGNPSLFAHQVVVNTSMCVYCPLPLASVLAQGNRPT